jgi:hypothetical protein
LSLPHCTLAAVAYRQPLNLTPAQLKPLCGLPGHQHTVDHRLDRPEPVNLAHRHGDRPGCRHASLPSKVSQHDMRRFSFAQVRHYSFAVTHQMSINYVM